MISPNILIVEDEIIIANDIKYIVEGLGYGVSAVVRSGEAAVQTAAKMQPDLVLMDIRLKGEMDGVAAAAQIQKSLDIPIVYLTAYTDESTLQRAKITEPFGYLVKPFEEREVRTAIEIALYKHKVEKKLKENEETLKKLSSALEQTADHVLITDKQGTIEYVNPAFERLTGYTKEEVIGQTPRILKSGKYTQEFYKKLWQTILSGQVFRATILNKKKNGDLFYEEKTISPLIDSQGNITHFVSTSKDISERMKALEALATSEERFRLIIENANDTIYTLNLNGVIIFANSRSKELTGYHSTEILGRHFSIIVHPEDQPAVLDRFAQRVRGEEVISRFELRILGKDSQIRWGDFNISLVQKEGNLVAIQVFIRDITQRKQMENALRQATQRYRQLFEEAPAMYVINRNENGIPILIDCNELLLKTLGYTREEILNQPGYKFYSPASRSELLEGGGYQRALTGKFTAEERQLVTRDGHIIETIIKALPENDATGQVTGTRAMYIDISERKKLQRQLEAVYRLGQELTLLRDKTSILRRVLETAMGPLQFDLALCGLIDETGGKLQYSYTIPENIDCSFPLDSEQGISVAVIRSGQALNIPDTSQDLRYVSLPGLPPGRSELCVPMKVGERVIGVLNVESAEPNRFNYADQQLLQTLADQAAVALENARLYTEIERHARELTIINKAARAMASSLDLKTVLQQSIAQVNPLLESEGTAILLLDPTGQELVFEFLNGPYPETLIGMRLPLTVGVVGWVAREGQSVLIDDASQEPRFYSGIDKITGLTTRSILAVPLKFKEKVIGVIEVINKITGVFNQRDLEMLEALSSSAAIAIENARLYEAERDQYHRLQQSQAQLIQVEKMAALGRLVASIAHEVNNPIQAVQNCLGLIKEELGEQQRPDKLGFYTDIAKSELDRIAAIVRRMRDFYRPARREQSIPFSDLTTLDDFYRLSPQELQPVDLYLILENVLQLANKQLQHNKVKVELNWASNLPIIQGSVDHLKQVFLNLVLNAIDAMSEQGGTLSIASRLEQVKFKLDQVQPAVRIEFKDTGAGMSPEVLTRIFEPLFTTKEHGSGFGLFTTYKIIEAHHGQIFVESQTGIGATFTILLPLIYV
jgi:PAS domain S-box-containing protein